jgi:arylsulfatase A-like enzyme
MFKRFSRPCAIGLLATGLGSSLPASTYVDGLRLKAAGRPNILLILADDLGYGDLGCYGQKRIRTPNLDRLAAEGMRFTQCYAGSPVCAPSRAALLTGQHTGHTRIRGNAEVPLAPEDVTVARVLHGTGYVTGAVGKWGLGLEGTTGHPNRQGFDEWFGYLDQTHAHNYYPAYLWRNERQWPLHGNVGGSKHQYSPDLFTGVSLNFLRINRHRPFFLYLAYPTPHANNELAKETGNGMEVPDSAPYTRESWPAPEKNKAAMITRMDADVGRLLARLKEMKIDEQTLILFSSDNGPHKEGGVDPAFFESAGPWRGIKRDLTEGGLRVPLLVRWPGRIRAGTVSDQVFAFWDVLPTLAELAGAKVPEKLDGLSLAPTLLGRKQTNQHEFLYWEFHEQGFHQAARMGDWKAIRHGLDQALELYHLTTDPGEKENVSGKNPDLVARIEGYFKTARTESKDWPLKPGKPPVVSP